MTAPAPSPAAAPAGWRMRVVPVVVAAPLFLQNLDTSIMTTALPGIAQALQVEPLRLNLAITAYLLSLAVFLPLSGWCADRFGARRVFCWAIGCFALGSALCGVAQSLHQLVVFRVLQGLGGALMVPVGRLILLRSVPTELMVRAMVWFTVPPAIGRMLGPLVGGAIVSFTSWRWIFLINVPCGLLGIALALAFIDRSGAPLQAPPPFDGVGFGLLAVGLTALLGAIDTAGKGLVSGGLEWLAAGLGLAALVLYAWRSRRVAHPLIDLAILRHPTFRASIVGGTPLRIAIGASPFLLPLMLQLGFGLSPLASGALTMATAVGSLATRVVMTHTIRALGFKPLLLGTTVATSLAYASYGLFTPATPHPLIFAVLLLGGLVNSMGMVALQTLGFSEIEKPRMSHATTLNTMAQQVSLSAGVLLGATLLAAAARWRGGDAAQLLAADFAPAFWCVGAMTMLSLPWFARLDRTAGDTLRV
ncbi:MFS transporter [Pseudorhodoferax sp.]|uniref:MFS transporter n=1 Tax=Pseudorhodoferax sp. TaxID=1993553 RepID=UPI0039E3EB01